MPPDEASVEFLGNAGRPSVSLRLSKGGSPVSLLATHPRTPMTLQTFSQRNDQLTEVGSFVRSRPGPWVVIGDLNMSMWSPWFKRLCGEAGLSNARRGFGVLATWPAFLPGVCRIPIDHCLVSDPSMVTGCRLGPDIGSDHLPLIVDLDLSPQD